MTFWPAMLRALLCLGLLLNGLVSAAASTRMAIAHQSHGDRAIDAVSIVEDRIAAPEADCHEPAIASHMARHAGMEAQRPGPNPAFPDGPSAGDCCVAGACNCACPLVAPHFAPAALPAEGAYAHVRSMRALASAHTAPALPHLIRPPIA